jgi:hypothetical protein
LIMVPGAMEICEIRVQPEHNSRAEELVRKFPCPVAHTNAANA